MTLTTLHRPQAACSIASRPTGLIALITAEAFAAIAGFGALIVVARTLGPREFAVIESSAAVVAVLLVLVRSGVEQIVIREAARRPRLIAPLTDTLISLKLACAGITFLGLVLFSMESSKSGVVLVAGLVLFPSALIADLGPRANGRLGPIAASQVLRSVGLLAASLLLVRSPADTIQAAGCVAIAELVCALVLGTIHVRNYGVPRMRFRYRACCILGRRSAIASISRLGRVVLYGADLLTLSAVSHENFGAYAASRRVVFALVALGLVLPGAFAPSIAATWTRGIEPTRKAISSATFGLMNLAIPAALGLMLTADGWTARLFGAEYRGAGLALIVLAARTPFLLAASLFQSALVAMRREMVSLRIVIGMLVFAVAIVPISARRFGAIGVGLAMVGVEALGAVLAWNQLRRLQVAPSFRHLEIAAVLASFSMIGVVLCLANRPVWQASLAGAGAFGGVWTVLRWKGQP